MTATRQERKPHRFRLRGAVLAAVLSAAAFAGWAFAHAATTELVAANRHTGLAIDGFDPVAYFTDASPSVGRADLEFRHAGATWRFRNEGNRAAFAADPGPYVPRFGGHDPIAIARGAAAPGHPRVWLIVDRRLYLFFSEESLAAFLENPELSIALAERRWPDVIRTLSR
jgi:hypothetical protein